MRNRCPVKLLSHLRCGSRSNDTPDNEHTSTANQPSFARLRPGRQELTRILAVAAVSDRRFQGHYSSRSYPAFGVFWNIGSDSSSLTHGNLSSSQIVFCGANGTGSSSDAIVTSTASESLLSSKNKCVPQHAAKERIRFACAILRGSPFVTTRSSRGTDPQVMYGAPALRRQSMQ
jgi:hypothetical protein